MLNNQINFILIYVCPSKLFIQRKDSFLYFAQF